MKFKVKPIKPSKTEAEILALLVTTEHWEREVSSVHPHLVSYLKYEDFEAKKGTVVTIPTGDALNSKVVIVIGIGSANEVALADLRLSAAKAGGYACSHKKPTLAIDLTGNLGVRDSLHEIAKATVEGVLLGSYKYNKYKSEAKKDTELMDVTLITTPGKLQHVVNGASEGELYGQATLFARDLINESPTVTTPSFLAGIAKTIGKKDDIRVEILDKKEIAKLGMGSYLAVNLGSTEPPKFIKLTYKGGKKKIVLAGKAITFDTGGLSLKDAKNMETMKLDMAGGAAVLGLFSVIAKLKPKATVIGLIAATENMPGPAAMKPGDIVTAMNGKTIEILNTDAEGRLTLADVLSYAALEKPDAIIDLATLTGACMVALGEEIAGLFSNNRALTEQLEKASVQAGEKLWELPLEESYRDMVKSHIADLQNIGKNRWGGAITAALFLEEFVAKLPWAHLDIAGPAFEERDTPLAPKGGVGFGVRTLLNYLKNI